MRSHRRREPLLHVLVAGDESDLDAVRALLALLPATAYGQVIVESALGSELPALCTPARVNVTHLRRPIERDDASHPAPGRLLGAAVDAWLAEWMPQEPGPDRVFSVWVGASARGCVRARTEHLQRL